MHPFVTVITVVRNGVNTIEETILSVMRQTYDNIEYIIIDGASTDNTIEIIKSLELRFKKGEFKIKDFKWLSEPDKGIYDAMNKAIGLANGEWLNFMNSGDRFVNDSVILDTFNQAIPTETEFIYSDWFLCDIDLHINKLFPVKGDYKTGNILHQSVIYKKELHKEFGKYLVTPKIIISDYIFFNLIPQNRIFKSAFPISVNDRNGLTSGFWTAEQKIAIDFVFSRISLKRMLYIYFRYFLHRLRKGKW